MKMKTCNHAYLCKVGGRCSRRLDVETMQKMVAADTNNPSDFTDRKPRCFIHKKPVGRACWCE